MLDEAVLPASHVLSPEGGQGGRSGTIAHLVRPLGGDVSVDGLGLNDADRAVLAEADIVIHSAAAVSFDSPLDGAVAVNLLGPSRVAQALTAAAPGDVNMFRLTCKSRSARAFNWVSSCIVIYAR